MTARRLLAAAVLPLAAAMTLVASTPWRAGLSAGRHPAHPPPGLGDLGGHSTAGGHLDRSIGGVVRRARPSWCWSSSLCWSSCTTRPGSMRCCAASPKEWRGSCPSPCPSRRPRWLFIPPVVLCWLVGAVSSELLTRSRTTGLAPLAGIVGFSLAYAATAGAPGTMVAEAALLGLSAGILLFVRRWLLNTEDLETRAQPGPSGRALTRPLVLGTLTLAVAAVVCALVIPQLLGPQGCGEGAHANAPDGDRRSHHPDGRVGRAAGRHGVEPGTPDPLCCSDEQAQFRLSGRRGPRFLRRRYLVVAAHL